MSLISTLRNGRKGFPQKGQVVFRLESSAVQPAMISSSYTRQSQVLQREQLEISSWRKRTQRRRDTFSFCGRLVLNFYIWQFYLHGVVVEDASVAGVPWRAEVRLVWQREARQSCIRMNKLSEYVRGPIIFIWIYSLFLSDYLSFSILVC